MVVDFCCNGWDYILLWVLLWLHSGSARQLYYISWSDLRLSGIDYSCCCNIDYHCTYCGDNYDICDADISDIQCRFAFLSAFYTVTMAMTTTLYQMLRRYCLGNPGLYLSQYWPGLADKSICWRETSLGNYCSAYVRLETAVWSHDE